LRRLSTRLKKINHKKRIWSLGRYPDKISKKNQIKKNQIQILKIKTKSKIRMNQKRYKNKNPNNLDRHMTDFDLIRS